MTKPQHPQTFVMLSSAEASLQFLMREILRYAQDDKWS